MTERVAITGMGVFSPIGENCDAFEASLRSGRCGIEGLGQLTDSLLSIGAQIKDFCFEEKLESSATYSADIITKAKRCARRSPKTIQSAVLATLQAWQQADLFRSTVAAERMAIIVAGSNFNQQYAYRMHQKFLLTPQYLTPWYALHHMDSDQVGTLSDLLDIRGEGFTVGGASASGNLALIKGYQLIRAGLGDLCLIVGVMADLSPMELQAFFNLGALGGKTFKDRPASACRPFDRDHEGFIWGQASACIVLESFQSVAARGARALAELIGGAAVLDGNRLADPNVDGEVRAMQATLNSARLAISDVNYLNAHGTSSPLGDQTEVAAIRRVFASCLKDLPINATKALTGHCLYSAGVIEAIATIIQIRGSFLHPNINLHHPIDTHCRFCGPLSEPAAIQIAMSNAFGFGGINSSILIAKMENNHEDRH